MTEQLRTGITTKLPPVILDGDVEADEEDRKRRLAGTLRDLTIAPGLEVPFSGDFRDGSFAA